METTQLYRSYKYPENKPEEIGVFTTTIRLRKYGVTSIKPVYSQWNGVNWLTDEGWEVIEWLEPLPKEDVVFEIDYNNIPQGEVLLLTTSKAWIIGDWYKGEWRTHRSQWVEENGINRLKSAFTKEEITHYSKLPSWENL